MTPEARARQSIDALLIAAGGVMQDLKQVYIHASQCVAIREFQLSPGHGFADYLSYIDGKACGVIEAKKEGATLSGVELQSSCYALDLPASLARLDQSFTFVWKSTGIEMRFTDVLDSSRRAKAVYLPYY